MLRVLRLLTADETCIGDRFDGDGLLEQAIEQRPSVARGAPIEPERELFEVVRQMRAFRPALANPEQQSFEERRDSVVSFAKIRAL